MARVYGYMTEAERQDAYAETLFDMESTKFDNDFISLRMDHQNRLQAIEAKTYLENYTDETLTALYKDELQIYQEGVAELWDRFKKWVKDLVDKILGRAKKNTEETKDSDQKEMCTMPYNLKAVGQYIDKATNAIRGIFSCKNDDGSMDSKKLEGMVFTGLGGLTLGAFVGKYINNTQKLNSETTMTVEDASKEVEECAKKLGVLGQVIDSGNKLADAAMEKGKEIGTKALSLGQKAVNACTAKLASLKNKKGEGEQSAEQNSNSTQQSGDNQPAEGENPAENKSTENKPAEGAKPAENKPEQKSEPKPEEKPAEKSEEKPTEGEAPKKKLPSSGQVKVKYKVNNGSKKGNRVVDVSAIKTDGDGNRTVTINGNTFIVKKITDPKTGDVYESYPDLMDGYDIFEEMCEECGIEIKEANPNTTVSDILAQIESL
jgi:outer membrane biosynthesis protein TonB